MIRSLYVIETGELTGLSMDADDALLALNTPPGCAWLDGAHNPQRASVQMVTDDFGTQQPVVVPRMPPRPADNDYQTWTWDEAAGGWIAVPTLLARQATARHERDLRMLASDWVTLRAFRTGQPIPPDWAAYMQALADVTLQPGFPDAIDWPTPPSA